MRHVLRSIALCNIDGLSTRQHNVDRMMHDVDPNSVPSASP